MNTGNNGPAGQPASGPGEIAETTTPNWPALLEKYRALAQADWDATRENDARGKDASKKVVRRLERATNDRLEEIVATIAGAEGNSLEALAVKMAVETDQP